MDAVGACLGHFRNRYVCEKIHERECGTGLEIVTIAYAGIREMSSVMTLIWHKLPLASVAIQNPLLLGVLRRVRMSLGFSSLRDHG